MTSILPAPIEEALAKTNWFDECEQTFTCDPGTVPNLPKPWIILQGYWTPAAGIETSIRVVPARGAAYLRQKTMEKAGLRHKKSISIPYKEGVRLLYLTKRIVEKHRHLIRDQYRRAWLVDYLPWTDDLRAESEYECGTDIPSSQIPTWLTTRITSQEFGYTRSRTLPTDTKKIMVLLARARLQGSSAPYTPSDSSFEWVAAILEELPTGPASDVAL